ncbi:unnamed protein product [Heterobilharzia americana]|nr:unnamed protein product [Heterobilharzia americana]
MEGLPRIPAVSLCLKKTDFVPELQPLKRYIEVQYQQPSSNYDKEFNEFLSLRKSACEPSIDYTGVSQQKRYYAQLQLLKGRFHFSAEKCTDVKWKWQDAFSNSFSESSDIRFEEASVMYNIAALHSILGVKERRSDADSMKIACTHFQCASWALSTLVERHLPLPGAPDLNSELMLTFGSIMLTQAQECVVEKSILDNRPANVNAKLSQYIMDTYENVGVQLLSFESNDKMVLPKFCKEWRRRCQMKTSFYSALTAYYAGIHEEENKAFGKAIAWFQLAVKRIEDCETMAKNFKDSENPSMFVSSGTFRASATYVGDIIRNKLTSSTKDNDFVYHESVPKIELLEQIKGVCIVKGVPFDHNDPEVRGRDIFHRLIPMNVLESASIYSEMKASLLRTLTGEVDSKEDELDKFLSTLYLDPQTMLTPDPPLPQSIYDRFASMDAMEQDPNRELSKQLKSLVSVSVDVDSEIKNLSIKLDDMEGCFSALLAVKGNEKMRNFSIIVKNLKERFKSLYDACQQAKQSNNQLREFIGQQLKSFDDTLKVSLDEFVKNLPSVNDLITDITFNKIFMEAQRLFDKVNEMRQQRYELNKDNLDVWFTNRLKTKHDNLVNIIKQNLIAQGNIQSALIDLNAEYAPLWEKLKEIRIKRSEQINHILSTGEVFDDILLKSKQGITFYNSVIDQLKQLDKEIDQLIEDFHKQLRSSMAELSKPISNVSTESLPRLPSVSVPSFPTLASFPSASIPSNQSVGDTSISRSQPHSQDVYFKPPGVAHSFSYQPTSQPQPPFRVPMPNIQTYNNPQQNTSVNFPPSSIANSTSSYTPCFSTSTPMPTALHQPPALPGGFTQTINMVNPLTPPFPRTDVSIRQTVNMPPSQPNNISNAIESRFVSNNLHPPVFSSTVSSQQQSHLPGNTGFPPSNNILQASFRAGNPLVTPNYLSLNTSQIPRQSIWPNQSMHNPAYQNLQPGYPQGLSPMQQPRGVGSIQQSQSNTPPPSALNYQQTAFHVNNYPLNPGHIPVGSHSYMLQPNQNQYTHTVQQPTSISTQFTPPTNVPQAYQGTRSLESSNNTTTVGQTTNPPSTMSDQKSPLQVLDTNNDVCSSSNMKSLSPIQPQVLTKADFDAKRREERLREAYSLNSTSQTTSIPSLNIKESSSNEMKLSTNSEIIHEEDNNNSYSNSTYLDQTTNESSIVTDSIKDHSISQCKFTSPEGLSDPLVLNRFIASAELLLTWLENPNELVPLSTTTTTAPSLNSQTNSITRLNKAWQKVQLLANDFSTSVYFNGKRPTQAAALCCPSKNRSQEFVPFDVNRVILSSSSSSSMKNDYINASYIDFQNNLGEWCPRYIITQAPLPKTVIDYWTMILEQGCEVIVMLIPSRMNTTVNSFTMSKSYGEGGFGDDNDPLRVPIHLPMNKPGSRLSLPGSSLEIRLQAIKESHLDNNDSNSLQQQQQQFSWTERILTIQNLTPNVVQLVAFINHVHTYYKQQRNLLRPIAIVCEYGAGLSGIFVTASVGILHTEMLGRMADVFTIAGYLCQQRRGVLNNSSQLYAAARLIGYSAIEIAARKDVIIGPRRRPSMKSENNTKLDTTIHHLSHPVNTNPLDNIFSDKSLRLDDLISVVDKWSVKNEVESVCCNSKTEESSKDSYSKNDSDLSTPENSLNTTDEKLTNSNNSFTNRQHDINIPEHLVDLNYLTKNSLNNKRFTRQDFENSRSSSSQLY